MGDLNTAREIISKISGGIANIMRSDDVKKGMQTGTTEIVCLMH